MIINLLSNNKNIFKLVARAPAPQQQVKIQVNWVRFGSNLITQNNKLILPKQLNNAQLKLLQMRLAELDQNNKLLLHLNKHIEGYPHKKINDNINNYPISSSAKFIDYSFNKNIKGNLGHISSQSPSRTGIIDFVIKIIKSLFTSLSCLIGNPQFINKHDKLILRIPFYQNNLRKDPLYTDKNVNFIYKNILDLTQSNKKIAQKNINILNSAPFKATKYNYNYLNSIGLSIPKRVLIKYLKDLVNLNINTSYGCEAEATAGVSKALRSNNFIDFDVIDNKIINDKLIENKLVAAPQSNFTALRNSTNLSKSFNNNLLTNLIRSNTLDYLSDKRLKSLKLIKNKPLLTKLFKKLNKERLNSTELIGKGKFAQPIDSKNLAKFSGGVVGIKGALGSTDYAPEYYNLSNYLIATNFINSATAKQGKENTFLNNKNNSGSDYKLFLLKWKLANKITKSIAALKFKYNKDYNEILNFIYNKIILNNQGQSYKFNYNQDKILEINKTKNILNSALHNGEALAKQTNINTIEDAAPQSKTIFNAPRLLKLISIIKNNYLPSSPAPKTNNDPMFIYNRIKQAFLSNVYYNNKTNYNNNILKNNINKFKLLGIFLSKIFAKNVEIQLIRLWSIGLDSSILSQVISKNSNFNNSRIIIRKLWKKISIHNAAKLILRREKSVLNQNSLAYNVKNLLNNSNLIAPTIAPCVAKQEVRLLLSNSQINNQTSNTQKNKNVLLSMLNVEKNNLKVDQINDFIKDYSSINTNPLNLAKSVGVFVNINGRLATERIRPRITRTVKKIGSSSKNKTTAVEKYRFTSKNKRGSFSVVITMGQARN